MASERRFQSKLIKELHDLFPNAIILKNDANYLQGMADILILYEDRWAALEIKESISAPHRPNQDYYVDLLGQMSYASFIYPENKERVLDELQRSFRITRPTRVSRRI